MCQTQFHDFLENTGAMISTNLPHKKLNPQLFVFKQNYTKYFICNINQLEGENKIFNPAQGLGQRLDISPDNLQENII